MREHAACFTVFERLTAVALTHVWSCHIREGAKDSKGCHTDTTDLDCELCKTDLWLSAVVSVSAPGRAVCPEHAYVLPGHPSSTVLLCRYTPGAPSCRMCQACCSSSLLRFSIVVELGYSLEPAIPEVFTDSFCRVI